MGMANMPFSPTAHIFTYLRYKAMLIALLLAPRLEGKEALARLADGLGMANMPFSPLRTCTYT
jgi:hypothetical protein